MDKREKVIKGLECCNNDECDSCPYYRSCDENDLGTCRATLHRDAIALLKAQEPRVLSFDEAMLDVNRDVIWIEIKGDPIIEPAINVVATNDSSSVMSPLSGDDDCALRCDRSLYGKTYRCWSSRPTDAQREAEVWHST